ncbi:aromatic ring-hydroxylating dioxygenase subunit alpha [Nocardia sp. CDC159]|uniref:Aromatic ring-hydroxylating dioxygenase subunit alpha n=1 Tax=Nocardia pulmonis TaxID=2951408 RepID=A0A9X2J3D4_9NOCA|nr:MULTISPECIES: aromatic ring-hydroxylating dioxygenase subunit alpha [Nocardia]MCM6778991.1 aromatic ring-hydroxylating dioxygenase subunit alpha [Nocardia pulmonis]MCM6791870.1 aromatic ring-hydroxylating dioxygenase subunit alpha [Nocardia sp. CDC159]
MPTATEPRLDTLLASLREYLGDAPPALSLPPTAYTSPQLWELERERIFSRSWFLVAHADQLREPGDYVSVEIAGEPVVVVRGTDDEVRALSPICRHRLMPLVEPGAGHAEAFTCQYHLWKYGLDGRLRGAPYMNGNKDFEARDCRLPEFAVEVWNGFVWVNLDAGAEPISTHLDLTADEFANYRLGEMVQVDSWSLVWKANWKLVMENGHENYHVLGLHRQTLEPFMPGGAEVYVQPYSSWVMHLRIPLTVPAVAESLSLNEVQKAHGMLLMGFPSGAFIAMGDQVVWLSFLPLTIDRVQVVGGVLTTPDQAEIPETTARTQQAVTAMINDEDRLGLEAVQRGVGSRFGDRGHLSPKEAPGMLAFYRNLAHALLE